MSIVVKQTDSETFEVTVEGRSLTTHVVTAPPVYVLKLTGGRSSAVQLVERSFEFLLEREPNTSILRSFELPVIQQYFPEYESTISASLDD
jgi:hypothetical protein